MHMTVHLGLTELKLMLRKKITMFSVLVVPVGLCVMAWFGDRDLPDDKRATAIAARFLILLVMSVFLVGTTVFTGRRQSLVLQRLRTSELTDAGVLAGITAPMFVVGLVQTVVYFGFCLAIGAPMPDQPLLVVLGVVTGIPLAIAAAAATAALSRSVEATQVTSIPVGFGAVSGIFLTASANPVLVKIGVAMPLMGPVDLVAKGWSGGPDIPVAIGSTLLWAAIFAVVIAQYFRWEPRQ